MRIRNLSRWTAGGLALFAGAMAGTVKGTVTNGAGVALAYVDVCLTSQSLCTQTDSLGAFRIDWTSTGIASRSAGAASFAARAVNGRLDLRLPAGTWSLRASDAAGRERARADALTGAASLALGDARGEQIFVRISGRNGASVLKLSPLGGWSGIAPGSGAAASGIAARATESGLDLRLTRDGYAPKHAVTADDSSALSLSLDTVGVHTVFAIGTDYSNNVASLERVTATGTDKQLVTWSTSDVVVAASGSSLFTLDRTDAVVTAYPEGKTDAASWQTNVGAGSNPYAVLAGASSYWVVLNGANSIAKLGSDGKATGSIDLSSQKSDTGSTVNAAVGVLWNGYLVVGAQRLNSWNPTDTSRVLLIDTATGVIAKAIDLPYANPQTISVFEDKAWLTCVGNWSSQDGALVEVDLSKGTTRTVVTEAQAGGDIASFEAAGPMRGYLGVMDASYNTSVRRLDLASGGLDAAVSGLSAVGCLHYDGTWMWVGNRATGDKQTLNALDPRTGAVVRSIKTELPPGSIASIHP